jgi:hypothetical protein
MPPDLENDDADIGGRAQLRVASGKGANRSCGETGPGRETAPVRPHLPLSTTAGASAAFLKGSTQRLAAGGAVTVACDPRPRSGALVELAARDPAGQGDLGGVGEALAGQRLAAKQPPPCLLQVEPAGALGDEHLPDPWVVDQPGLGGNTGMAGEVIGDHQDVAGWLAASARSISRRTSHDCRTPLGLPTRQVVTEDRPHPPAELMTIAAPPEPRSSSPAVPRRALSIGRQRSSTDNHVQGPSPERSERSAQILVIINGGPGRDPESLTGSTIRPSIPCTPVRGE